MRLSRRMPVERMERRLGGGILPPTSIAAHGERGSGVAEGGVLNEVVEFRWVGWDEIYFQGA
jgi:hypothetical protein